MNHLTEIERNQLVMITSGQYVLQDSYARVIDAFVDAIDINSFSILSETIP